MKYIQIAFVVVPGTYTWVSTTVVVGEVTVVAEATYHCGDTS
jgi:hypothetical protein